LKQINRVSADVLRDETERAEILIKRLCQKACIIVIKPKSSALSEEKGSYTRLTLLCGTNGRVCGRCGGVAWAAVAVFSVSRDRYKGFQTNAK